MKKQLFVTILLFVAATQIFPVQGVRFWYNILQQEQQIDAPLAQIIEEEQLDELESKDKKVESSHSYFLEYGIFIAHLKSPNRVIVSLGQIIDRNEPILIPPPNQFT